MNLTICFYVYVFIFIFWKNFNFMEFPKNKLSKKKILQ